MDPSAIRPAIRGRGVAAFAIALGLVVAACSGSASSPSTVVQGATASPIPSKGPAAQSLTIAGPVGVTGALSHAAISCNEPSADGLEIGVLAQPTDPNLSVYIFVLPGKVTVRFDSGSGSTYVERDFEGTGVTSFDASKGAQIDAPLTEVTTTGAHGSLGVLTSIAGSIDCGNQTPGSSTLSLSGLTPKGALSGGLDPVNVQCVSTTTGSRVSVMGMGLVGSTPTLVIISLSPNAFTTYPVNSGFYRNTSTAVVTLTATGAHVEGDAVEQNPAKGTTAHTVHVSGDVTCGTSVAG